MPQLFCDSKAKQRHYLGIVGQVGAQQPAPGYDSQMAQYGQQTFAQAPQNYPAQPYQTQYPGPVDSSPQQPSTPQVKKLFKATIVPNEFLRGISEQTCTEGTSFKPFILQWCNLQGPQGTVAVAPSTQQPQPQPVDANTKRKKLESANVLPPGYAAVDGPDPLEEVSVLYLFLFPCSCPEPESSHFQFIWSGSGCCFFVTFDLV